MWCNLKESMKKKYGIKNFGGSASCVKMMIK